MTLEYKEQNLGFEFGLYFLGKAQGFLGYSDFNELLQSLKTRADIVELMYVSAMTYAKIEKKPFDISLRDWINAFESNEIEATKITEFEGLFVESIEGAFGIEKDNVDDTSKKK